MTQACKPLTLRRENAIPGLQELFVVVVAGFDLVCFCFCFALFFFFNIVSICGRKTQAGPES